ncbi:MAG: TIR domain-containing protein [Actinomycetota bacterium]
MTSPGSPRWDVFLCHSSKDKRRVERLYDEFVARGLRVWFDKTAIVGSASVPLKVEEGLEQSRTVALCLSPAFLASEWTAYERASALHGDPANLRASLLLIEFAPCRPPRGLAHFRRLKFHRFSKAGVDEIVESLPISPTPSAAKPPSAVTSLLDDAKDKEGGGGYIAAGELTKRALDLALTAGAGTDEGARELARARTAHSHALLLCDRDFESAWELADAGADPAALDGYPDLLFSALAGKAEAAMATGRMRIALGAALAAEELAQDEDEKRTVLQLRAQIALRSRSPAEAVALYEEAEQSFLALLNSDPDAAAKIRAKVGVGSCLTNKALALRGAGDIAVAKLEFSRAADWYVQGGSPSDESVARRFLARCHFDEHDWDAGFAVLDEAQRLAEQENLTSGLVACLELRARALATTDQAEPARAALLRAVEVLGDQDPEMTRRFHQMLATLAEQLGDRGTARRHLDTARVMAEQAGDPLTIADVAHQTEELAKRWKREIGPAPDDVIAALRTRLEQTEHPGEAAHTMQQLAGAYRSHGDLQRARDWHQRAHDAAMTISDQALAAGALIGLAEVAIADEDDVPAAEHLQKALGLVDRLPAWEVKASALYFASQLQARSGDLRAARRTLDKAHTIATKHHVDHLAAEVERLRDDIDDWLSIRALPSTDLAALAEQLASLEDWYPEARRRLRRLWWYWQGDEVMRNLISHSGAKSLIVTDNAAEVDALADDLAVLFDAATFVTESSFAQGESIQTFVPFPTDLAFPYMNVLAVQKTKGT